MALNQHTRITVPLSRDEFEALRDNAIKEYRHPRDHARFLLRQVLLGNSLEKGKTAGVEFGDPTRGFVGVNP